MEMPRPCSRRAVGAGRVEARGLLQAAKRGSNGCREHSLFPGGLREARVAEPGQAAEPTPPSPRSRQRPHARCPSPPHSSVTFQGRARPPAMMLNKLTGHCCPPENAHPPPPRSLHNRSPRPPRHDPDATASGDSADRSPAVSQQEGCPLLGIHFTGPLSGAALCMKAC